MRTAPSDEFAGQVHPLVHVADDTWVAASPSVVAAAVADPARWRRWWPDLELEVTRDRGLKGLQWLARTTAATPATPATTRRWPGRRPPPQLSGSLEIWLEPWRDGVVLHHYARLDAVPALSSRAAERARTRRVLRWKRAVHALKDELERR